MGDTYLCGDGVLCPWMSVAVAGGKVFRWREVEGRKVLFVRVPNASERIAAACPACGGIPRARQEAPRV